MVARGFVHTGAETAVVPALRLRQRPPVATARVPQECYKRSSTAREQYARLDVIFDNCTALPAIVWSELQLHLPRESGAVVDEGQLAASLQNTPTWQLARGSHEEPRTYTSAISSSGRYRYPRKLDERAIWSRRGGAAAGGINSQRKKRRRGRLCRATTSAHIQPSGLVA